MKSQTSIKKNFIYQMIYQILIIILPFVTSPYIARTIGAEGLGTYSYSYSIAYYFEDYTQLKEYVKLYYNNVRDYYILLPVDAIGAIRVDRRRRSYSNYLIPPSCILLPHP